MGVASIVVRVAQFYTYLIIGYVLMSWFPVSGVLADVKQVLASLVEPYLGLFRRIIPPIGMFDISPFVAILVLNLVVSMLIRLF